MAKKTTAPKPETADTPEPAPLPTVSLPVEDWQSVLSLIETATNSLGWKMLSNGQSTYSTADKLIREISRQAAKQ